MPDREDPAPLIQRLTLAALVTVYGVCVLRTAWISDDAYITFRTVDNFVAGYGLRWNVAERVQSYTHPLWMLVVAALYFVTREFYFTVLVTSILLSLATVILLGGRALRAGVHPLLLAAGLGALSLSRGYVDYSTSGLENALSHLLLVIFIFVYLEESHGERRLFALALLAGLAGLNRTDTLLFYAPALALELWHRRDRRNLARLALGLAPLLLWECFSVVYYGFPFANSAYAKLRTGLPTLESWEAGLDYFANSLRWDPVTLITIAAGLIFALVRGDARCRALAGGVLLYLIYIVNIGGDFMAGRFFAAPLLVVVATVLLALAPQLERPWIPVLLPVAVLVIGLLGATPTLLSGSAYKPEGALLMDASGIANERAFYFPWLGLFSSVTRDESVIYETIEAPQRAAARHDPLAVKGAVGVMGVNSGPGTYVLDYHALGDPLLSRMAMVQADPLFGGFCVGILGKPCVRSWRIGHFLRNIPDGYIESLLADENLIADPDLHEFYDKLRLITRGPLWSAERWSAIVQMNLGLYDHLLGPRSPVPYRATGFVDVIERQPELKSRDVLRGAANQYDDLGEPEKAVGLYQKVLASDESDPRAWNEVGSALLKLGKVDDAIEHFRKAVALRPTMAMAHYNLGIAMEKAQRTSEAIEEYRIVVRLQPKHILGHYNLGILLFNAGDQPGAVDELRQVVALKPEDAVVRNVLGMMLLQAGERREAATQLREAVRLKPDYAAAVANLRLALQLDQESQP